MRRELQSLDTDDQYDVIFCAEILYYVGKRTFQSSANSWKNTYPQAA